MLPSCIAPLRAGAFALFLGLFGLASPAPAHEGHDHGAPAAPMGAASPRVGATSEQYELVGIVEGEVLVLYLDRFASNEPVRGAKLAISLNGTAHAAEPQADGTYEVTSPLLRQPGAIDLIAEINEGEASDLLVGALTIPAPAQPAEQRQGLSMPGQPLGIGLIVGGLLGLLLGLGLRSRPKAVLGLALLLLTMAPVPGFAHEGHDHGAEPAAIQGNAPHRRPDGSIFLSKPTQRLLDVRTEVAAAREAVRTRRFAGRIIADPNRSGQVQGSIGGRITPTERGLPRLGQRVKAGEVLAHVQPAFQPVDAATLQQTEADLDQQIALQRLRLERQRVLVERNAVPRQTLEETEIQLRGLERRRAELSRSKIVPEPLVAPVDGIVAEVRVAIGQVVQPSDVLFQVIDPAALWVEALVFDQIDPAKLGAATARIGDGRVLTLRLVGRSRSLQQQATLLQFAIENPPEALDIGLPVSVIAEAGERATGIVLPRAAVTQAPNGQSVVFQHREPELFVPRPVRVEALDAERVLVLDGLAPGERIVTRNAPLINQVR